MRQSAGVSHRIAAAVWVAAICATAPAFGQTAAQVAEFERQLALAANAGDTKALASFTTGIAAERFQWVSRRGMTGSGGNWTARVISDPGPSPDPASRWVAFSRYQVCESGHDVLFRLAGTPDALRVGDEVPETDIGGYRVRHHEAAVTFKVPAKRALITDRITVERQPGAGRTMVLRLNSPYAVSSIRAAGSAVPFQRAGGFLAVRPPDGQQFVLDLAYEAVVDGHTEEYILPDHAALTAYWYPHTGRLPATARVAITAPKAWHSIFTGAQVSRVEHGDEATTTFQNDVAICYLTIAAGDYRITTKTSEGIAVSAYMLPSDADRGPSVVDVAQKALLWFSHNFSPFPFKTYAVVDSHVFPAALECYSFTLCGSGTIPGAVPHEISHTWWGGIVPNTYTRSMWNESFATYSDGLYQRSTAPGPQSTATAATEMMSSAPASFTLLDAADAMDFRQASVGYGKGGAVLRELERALGKEKMLATFRRFIANHKPGDDAEWKDYVQAVCDVSGAEWAGFFESWLSRTDLPDLKLENVSSAASGSGFVVNGTLAFKGAPFWAAVPVVVSTPSSDVKQYVLVKGAPTPFEVRTTAKPTRVKVDPANEMLRKRTGGMFTPTLATLHTGSGPLLIVYATGGSPEAAASARQAATVPAKTLFVFATITVKADTEVAEQDLANSNVLLLGRAEDLHLPGDWAAKSPIASDGQSLHIGEETWQGADWWGLAILPHPTRANGFVAYAVGAGPNALQAFGRQGDLDTGQSLFVVGGDGKPTIQRRAGATNDTDVVLTPK